MTPLPVAGDNEARLPHQAVTSGRPYFAGCPHRLVLRRYAINAALGDAAYRLGDSISAVVFSAAPMPPDYF